MTRLQFEQLAKDILREKFESPSFNPLRFAVARAEFKRTQLARLIEAGSQVKDSKTVMAKVSRYQRQLDRMAAVPHRFRELFGC